MRGLLFVCALLSIASAVHATPWGLTLEGGAARVDARSSDGRSAGGFGGGLAVGLTHRLSQRVRLTADLGLTRFRPTEIDREGRILSLGPGVEVALGSRVSVGGGAAVVMLSTTPHELTMSRGLALPVRASVALARYQVSQIRATLVVQPTFFGGGGFSVATLLLVGVSR